MDYAQYKSNRPDDALMVSHMEVLAMLLAATGLGGNEREDTLSQGNTNQEGADYLRERDSRRSPCERSASLGFLLEVCPGAFSIKARLCVHFFSCLILFCNQPCYVFVQ